MWQEPHSPARQTFAALFAGQVEKYRFAKAYKGFYDNRDITVFDPQEVVRRTSSANTLSDILNEKNLRLASVIQGLKSDIETLETIQPKSSGVNTFDFDGRRHDRDEAQALILKLKGELNEANSAQEFADKEMFRLFWRKSKELGRESEAVKADFIEVR